MFLFLLLALSGLNAETVAPPELAHWEFLLTEVQTLADHNGNEDPELKINDIVAPMTACHDKQDDMQTIGQLVKIYQDGIAIGKKHGMFARVRMGIGEPRQSLFVAETALRVGEGAARELLEIVVAERRKRLDFRDPQTMALVHNLPVHCAGIDHMDFTADGRFALVSCEFAGRVAVVDVATHRVLRMIDMPHRHIHMGPQDIKLAPDGSVFYIADSDQNGVWVLDGAATHVLREIPTGRGAHGLYLSRGSRRLFVTDRSEGAVSVLDAYTGAMLAKWTIPGGGSPDMGNVTADGSQLWLSGRYHGVVYVLSTVDGHLIRKIPVGKEPHGLCVWPQPGRYSLGHTGILR